MPRPMTESRQEGPDLRHWARLAWRRKWLLGAIVVLIPLAAYVGSSLLPKTYESTATVNVKPTASASTVFSTQINSSSDISEAQTLIQTTLVGSEAARVLHQGANSARELLDHVSVTVANGSETVATTENQGTFLEITASDSDPVRAAQIANAFARATANVRTRAAIANIDRILDTLSVQGASEGEGLASQEALAQQIQTLRGLRAGQGGTTPLVEAAVPADSPSSPKPVRNAILAFVLALLLAIALVPLLDRIDRKIHEPRELEELLDPPLLATIPDDAFPGHMPGNHVKEAFQTLRASLTYFNIDRPLSTLVIASAAQQDGKTTVAVNLAIAYALDERDVILVDADLRRPQIAYRLGKQAKVGLDSVLVGTSTLDEAFIEVDAGAGRLRILPGATPPPNPAVLLGSERMRTLLLELSEQADVVIVDTPAILAVSDALPLVSQVAGTVVVARLHQTPKDAVHRMNNVITSAGGSVLGTVATGVRTGDSYGYYGYGYYGDDGRKTIPPPDGHGSSSSQGNGTADSGSRVN
jgi:capsular exopolysaccharide synthesis family protein